MDQKLGPDWVTGIKEGYRTKTIKLENCTAVVHRPILHPEERARREEQIKRALANMVRKGII